MASQSSVSKSKKVSSALVELSLAMVGRSTSSACCWWPGQGEGDRTNPRTGRVGHSHVAFPLL